MAGFYKVYFNPWMGETDPSTSELEKMLKKKGFQALEMMREDGGFVSMPVHPKAEQVVSIIKGKIDLEVKGRVFPLNPGDHIIIPEKTPYLYRVITPDGTEYFVGHKKRIN